MKEENKLPALSTEHLVLVSFENGLPYPDAFYETVHKLLDFFEDKDVGFFDGYCTAEKGNHGWLYLYGPDADKLFETVKPLLEKASFLKGANVLLRYGPPVKGTRFREIKL